MFNKKPLRKSKVESVGQVPAMGQKEKQKFSPFGIREFSTVAIMPLYACSDPGMLNVLFNLSVKYRDAVGLIL